MIVLTGGAGFIGSCFLKKLNDNGIKEILVVDHLGNSEKWKNFAGKRFYRYEHKDEFRNRLNSGIYNGAISSIIHIGACSTTTERNADYLFDNNLNYSIELAEFAAEEGIRFIYASSAATYGDGQNGYSDMQFENLQPLNIYGMTKHLFDLWVIDNKLDSDFTGLKFFNVFGPNEYHKGDMSSMVYKSFNQIKNTGNVKLFKSGNPNYKDGEQMRDFVYIKDVVNIMWDIFQNEKFAGIYNIGTGLARTWNDLAASVFKAMDMELNIEYINMPDSLENQYQYFTQAEMKKIGMTDLPFKFRPLEESIDDYVRNYLIKDWQYY
ncbi:MAG: ADP-L-glycero-D-manno-heptose 6-epimerase [Bacteroidota bacterium]|nr:ADP-L-glycero-D-manno-heptose 6-epimerase [Bacteroidota bacterium]